MISYKIDRRQQRVIDYLGRTAASIDEIQRKIHQLKKALLLIFRSEILTKNELNFIRRCANPKWSHFMLESVRQRLNQSVHRSISFVVLHVLQKGAKDFYCVPQIDLERFQRCAN